MKGEGVMTITNTKGIGVDTLKMLVIGEPGSGKTFLAGTINEPTIIISAEAGLLCLKDKDIDVFDITRDNKGGLIPKENRIARLGEAYKFLLSDAALKKYKWVYIDSLSEISQNLMEQLYTEFPERKDTLPMYGENAKRMRSLIKSFRDLPGYNVVFSCLSTVDKDENGQRYIGVSIVGSMADKIAAFFDEVFYLNALKNSETGKIERQLITEKSEKLVAKDRSGMLDRIEPANLALIANKIRGKKKEQNVKS